MPKRSTIIRKASGEEELFSPGKLENSLRKAGADDFAVSEIILKIEKWLHEGISTKKIYKKAHRLLAEKKPGMAARYGLKRAIMELGPTGYPFENFIGQLLHHIGFSTEVGKILEGKCITHEVDVIATGDKVQYFIECKYYNSQGKFADVKVPLYIHSRFEDIREKRKQLPEFKDFTFQGWLITNTRFTSDAMDYGKCAGLKLVSWDYPSGNSLKELIEREHLFPLTALTLLYKDEKQQLLDKGIVLCRQILKKPELLDVLEIQDKRKLTIMEEINDLLHFQQVV